MATYLELCKAVRVVVGMQGTGPTTVVNPQGIEEVIVRAVRDAYVDIQNTREEFSFLLADRSFNLASGTDTYAFLSIFGSSTPAFKKYKKDSFRITDGDGKKRYLCYVDRDVLEARYLNDDQQKLPTQYTVNPANNNLIFKPIPDGLYTVEFRYWKSPEILSTDNQVPALPLSLHNLILYKAVEKVAIYLGSPETYSKYSTEAAKMMGELMRLDLPKKRMNAGALV